MATLAPANANGAIPNAPGGIGENGAHAHPDAANGNDNSANGPIYVDTQHDDMIHDAQMDYYGTKLATSSSDRTVKIYDVIQTQTDSNAPNAQQPSYHQTATLTGHSGPVWQVSWAHPKYGIVLASCSFDGSIILHRETRPREWTPLHTARNLHDSSVNSVQFAPHEYGLIVAGASSDGRVSVLQHQNDDSWLVDYVQDSHLGVNALDFAPFASYEGEGGSGSDSNKEQNEDVNANPVATSHPTMRMVTGGCDNRIRFWKKIMDSNQTHTKWQTDPSPIDTTNLSHSDWIRDVAWAPSSAILPDVNLVASCSEDRTVILWTQTGGEGQPWIPQLLHTFDDPVWRVSWSVTGCVLAVSSGDDKVTLWKQQAFGSDGDGECVWAQVGSVNE